MTTATTGAATDAAMDAAVVFTEQAARKVSELMENEERDDLKLRVFVTGGGCSGFQYGFSFEDEQAEDDTAVDTLGVRLLIDPMSVVYLEGAEIDYRDDVNGAQFVIRNPNASTTCGCGSSFSI